VHHAVVAAESQRAVRARRRFSNELRPVLQLRRFRGNAIRRRLRGAAILGRVGLDGIERKMGNWRRYAQLRRARDPFLERSSNHENGPSLPATATWRASAWRW
jgi:hypothetical protein